jgi:hypothetical protein
MDKGPRDVYNEMVGDPLEGFQDWSTREIFLGEVKRLEGGPLYTDGLGEYARMLQDDFRPLSLADYLAPMNGLLADICSEIEQQLQLPALASHNQKLLANNSEMFVAAFPLTSLNAQVNRVGPGKHLILLNMGLTHTIYILSKLCTSQIRLGREIPLADWKPAIEIDQVRDYLKKYFAKYLETKGRVPTPDHLDIPWTDSHISFLSNMVSHAEKFVVAHEIGHILNGHLTDEHLKPQMLADAPVETYESSFEMEYDADRTGFEIAFADFPPEDQINDIYLRAAIAGVNVVFRSIEILEKLLGVESETHPPAGLRRYEFQRFARSRYMENNMFMSNRIDYLLDYELKDVIPR